MSNRGNEGYGNARLTKQTLRRIKAIAAVTDQTIGGIIEPAMQPVLRRLEEKHLTGRLRAVDKPARVKPVD